MRKVLGIGAIGLAAAGLGAAAAAFEMRIHPAWRSWGIDPDEIARSLPGDDLVEEPAVVDTRGITIDAPPEAVWPWLVQMGHHRGGWYSYDQLDMRGPSIREIVPEWQSIAVGDIIPTDEEGGFRVAVVDPGRTLVLHLTSADFAGRSSRRRARRSEKAAEGPDGSPVETFAASWTFVLEPLPAGRTRLIERCRIRMLKQGFSGLNGPALDLGVFIMVRRQMLGIRDRAEQLQRAGGVTNEIAASEGQPGTRAQPRQRASGKEPTTLEPQVEVGQDTTVTA